MSDAPILRDSRPGQDVRKIHGAARRFGRRSIGGALASIIGPNGAGKSTYFNLISGAFPPSAGRILFEGADITGTPQHRFARMGIAKSFQITNVFPLLTAQENVRVALQALVSRFDIWRPRARLPGLEEQAGALLETVGLWRRRERQAAALAHGEQRALEIAMALAASPRLLLLDEPTAGMSPEETRGVMDLIVRLARERTVILVEHKMKLVMGISDRLLVLHQGETLGGGDAGRDQAQRGGAPGLSRRAAALMLRVEALNAWYGRSHILQGLDLEVRAWRARLPGRAQRRGENDDAAHDHGSGRPGRGTGDVRGQGRAAAAGACAQRAGDRLCAGGAADRAGALGAGQFAARPARDPATAARAGGDRRSGRACSRGWPNGSTRLR